MKLLDVLNPQSIALKLDIKSKDELLIKMVELAELSGKLLNKEDVLNEIIKREKIMSTGIGKGIALPHAKTNSVEDIVGAFVTLNNSIEFDSLDGSRVDVAFMIIGKENNVGNHLRTLSKISRLLNNDTFRHQIKTTNNPNDIISIITNFENDMI
jgi:fructose-specific phosphotransferase system IIA component